MKINPKINEALREISEESIKYSNNIDGERKHLKRLIQFYIDHLREDEQIYIFKLLLEQSRYRNIITDPDNIIHLSNIKLRGVTYVFFLTVAIIIIIAILFKTHTGINGVIEMFSNLFKFLTI